MPAPPTAALRQVRAAWLCAWCRARAAALILFLYISKTLYRVPVRKSRFTVSQGFSFPVRYSTMARATTALKCFGILCFVCVAAQTKIRGSNGDKVVKAKTSWQPDFVIGEHGKIALTDDAAEAAAQLKITSGADTGAQMATVTGTHEEKQQIGLSSLTVGLMSVFGAIFALLVFAVAIIVVRRVINGNAVKGELADPPQTPAAMGADEPEEPHVAISRKVTKGQWLTEFNDPVAMM
jgi:hypothetical protein